MLVFVLHYCHKWALLAPRSNVSVVTCIAFALLGIVSQVKAQDAGRQDVQKPTQVPAVRDEYSVMDDEQPKRSIRETIALRVENTRLYYLKALSLLEKRDTIHAALSFENAISEISLLNSMSGVERDDEYTTMLQSLCDD